MNNKMTEKIRKDEDFVYKIVITLLVALFAYISYNIIPKEEMDLYRYYENIKYFGTLSFSEFINNKLLNNYEPIFNTISFILGKLNVATLFPVLVLIAVSCINFFIYFDYIKGKNIKSCVKILSIIYILGYNIVHTMLGIRSVLAMAIVLLILYLQKVKKVKHISLLYSIPIMIHFFSSLLVVLVIFLTSICSKLKLKNKQVIICVAIISALVIYICLNYINIPLKKSYNLVEYIIIKSKNYINFDGISGNLFNMDTIIRLVICIFSNVIIFKLNKLKDDKNKQYYSSIFTMNIIYMILIFILKNHSVYNRYYDFLAVANILLLNEFSNENNLNKIAKCIFISIGIIFIIFAMKNQYLSFMYNILI